MCFFPDRVGADPFLPTFDIVSNLPGQPADNPYFSLATPATRIFLGEGEDDEGEAFTARSELTGMGPGPEILGVQTTIQRDRAFEDGLLVEEIEYGTALLAEDDLSTGIDKMVTDMASEDPNEEFYRLMDFDRKTFMSTDISAWRMENPFGAIRRLREGTDDNSHYRMESNPSGWRDPRRYGLKHH